MDKLQVELSEATARITQAVRKHINCDEVTVAFDKWTVSIHAWKNDDIIASVYVGNPATKKQIVQQVHQELRLVNSQF